jgi:hypothetical protein
MESTTQDRPVVSQDIIKGLSDYYTHHRDPGRFLRAVLSNDLLQAHATADDYNERTLGTIVRACYNCLPPFCWGTSEKVERWLAQRNPEPEIERSSA